MKKEKRSKSYEKYLNNWLKSIELAKTKKEKLDVLSNFYDEVFSEGLGVENMLE